MQHNAGEEFDAPFARLDWVARNRFDIYWHRHTGGWFVLHRELTLAQAIETITRAGLLHPTKGDIVLVFHRMLTVEAPAGLSHVDGPDHGAGSDFARKITELAGVNVPVEAVPTSGFPTSARRPPYSVLSSGKLASVTGGSMPPWQYALDRYLIAKGDRHSQFLPQAR